MEKTKFLLIAIIVAIFVLLVSTVAPVVMEVEAGLDSVVPLKSSGQSGDEDEGDEDEATSGDEDEGDEDEATSGDEDEGDEDEGDEDEGDEDEAGDEDEN